MHARRTRRILYIAAALAVIACIVEYAPRVYRRYRAEQLAAEFEKNPTAALTRGMLELLAAGEVGQDSGNRVFARLVAPRVHTRKAYALGRPVICTVEWPPNVHFGAAYWRKAVRVECEGQASSYDNVGFLPGRDGGDPTIDISDSRRLGFTARPAQTPGVHRATLRIDASLAPYRTETTWQFNRMAPFPGNLIPSRQEDRYEDTNAASQYRYSTTIALELNLVPESMEEKVALVSNPAIDGNMKAAFSPTADAGMHSFGRLYAADWRETRGGIILQSANPPLDAVFKITYIGGDGTTLACKSQRGPAASFVFYAGESERVALIERLPLAGAAPGAYSGILRLEPDPESAYLFPAIKAIWNGVLEFPVTFEVELPRQTASPARSAR